MKQLRILPQQFTKVFSNSKKTLENIEGAIDNGQSRGIGHIITRHRTKANNTKNTQRQKS